jgi:alcohol/geraniol dehydrogenase (NADP+)
MPNQYRAYAAASSSSRFELSEFDAGPLGAEEVDIQVESCGVCHSDLSMQQNEWGNTRYPFVGGHEIVGRVIACGAQVKAIRVNDLVGVGWTAGSCGECDACLNGDPIFCAARSATIIGRNGGFAERVRAHWQWTIKLPDGLDAASAGPLFCGGITVFNPLLEFGILPIHRVAVVGIGGLGHLALKMARAWGCEVTAITRSESKIDDALALGAHQVLLVNEQNALARFQRYFDLIIQTTNAAQDWAQLLKMLSPRGKLALVGVTLDAIPVQAMQLINGQKSLVGNATGSPQAMRQMLEFCARHQIKPQVEYFPMQEINAAFAHLEKGDARYRVVLQSDWR